MSDTAVSLLTAPGTGAIATVQVCGPRAWELARELFKPAGKLLPVAPEVNCFWFGTLGADEVILAVVAPLPSGRGSLQNIEPRPEGSGPTDQTIEIHCHGGRRVVRMVIEQFTARGCIETIRTPCPSGEGFELLQGAPTLRTASILLDQLNGAFATEVRRILALIETEPRSAAFALHRLAELGNTAGRHLVEPWKVVIAGPPNVGKSSLVNALAGYQRSVVSEVAGTTRDAVSVRTAFDGWPAELIDTAGLRDAEGLEAEGIEHARDEMAGADLVLWVMDATASQWEWPVDGGQAGLHTVLNKCDALVGWGTDPNAGDAWGLPLVSAQTGEGVPALAAQLVARLIPSGPAPGAAVPFTPQLADLVEAANTALIANRNEDAARFLRAALEAAE